MTRITFLHGASHRLNLMADWVAGRCASGATPVLIYAPDPDLRELMDRLLWTRAATGFVPHCHATSVLATETPVIIAEQLDQPIHDHCLLNLSNDIPPGFSRFQELVEIVSTDDTDRLPGRERFRIYREQGYPLENRDISRGL